MGALDALGGGITLVAGKDPEYCSRLNLRPPPFPILSSPSNSIRRTSKPVSAGILRLREWFALIMTMEQAVDMCGNNKTPISTTIQLIIRKATAYSRVRGKVELMLLCFTQLSKMLTKRVTRNDGAICEPILACRAIEEQCLIIFLSFENREKYQRICSHKALQKPQRSYVIIRINDGRNRLNPHKSSKRRDKILHLNDPLFNQRKIAHIADNKELLRVLQCQLLGDSGNIVRNRGSLGLNQRWSRLDDGAAVLGKRDVNYTSIIGMYPTISKSFPCAGHYSFTSITLIYYIKQTPTWYSSSLQCGRTKYAPRLLYKTSSQLKATHLTKDYHFHLVAGKEADKGLNPTTQEAVNWYSGYFEQNPNCSFELRSYEKTIMLQLRYLGSNKELT
uniref:Predicted protein n=1 Tax=Physcomitrium patens TaxID=3218 RepID=A9U4I6_PHYPA